MSLKAPHAQETLNKLAMVGCSEAGIKALAEAKALGLPR